MRSGKIIIIFSLLAALLLQAVSCTEKDAAPPVISLLSPQSGDTLMTGEKSAAVLELRDNSELLQYTIIMRIKNDPIAGNVMEPYLAGKGVAIFGQELLDTFWFDIPKERAAGVYLLQASAIDLAANPSNEIEIEVSLRNPIDMESPVIQVSSLNDSGSNIYAPNAGIRIEGTALDNRELGAMRIEIFKANGERVSLLDMSLSRVSNAFATSIAAPAEAGHYNLLLTVADNVNNLTSRTYALQVQ